MYSNEKGIALVTALLFLIVLTILGTTAIVISSTDIKIGGNYKTTKQAFNDAEAGIQYAIKNIENGLSAKSLSLAGSSVPVSYTAPPGFSFDPITTLTQVGTTNKYSFQAVGRASNNAKATIQVVIKQNPFFNYGVFGDELVELKACGCIYSYDSRVTPNPAPPDTTGKADVGSNVAVQTYMDTYVDGDVALGNDGLGNEGVYTPNGVPIITGTAGLSVDRVDPDPLGAIGGDLATTFATVSVDNDNASAGITGDSINLGNGQAITLHGKAGGANYYLTGVNLNNGATLNVDATLGPVNIYLTGSLDAKNGSAVNIAGSPPDFTIYSNSTDSIAFRHSSTFKGTVYAPYAPVEMKNGSDVYGLIWARTADIKNSGQFFFDMALKDKHLSSKVSILSWKEVR